MDGSSRRSRNESHELGAESVAAKTTIVGARPPGPGRQLEDVPRGIEVLIKKASVDPAFRQLLLDKRAEAAREIALELLPAEIMALNAIPRSQLEKTIEKTTVPDPQRRAFLGQVGAVMLAALTLGLSGCDETPTASAKKKERSFDVEKGFTVSVAQKQTYAAERLLPSIVFGVQEAGAGSLTVLVGYHCPFETGEVTIDVRQSPDVAGANITYEPAQPAAVAKGDGYITFRVSGSGGTTDWLIAGLRATTADCKDSPALSPPRKYNVGGTVDDCAAWEIVKYHKEWPPQK
jgi:hypothetical protein